MESQRILQFVFGLVQKIWPALILPLLTKNFSVNNSELSKVSEAETSKVPLVEGWSGYKRMNHFTSLDRDVKITSPT